MDESDCWKEVVSIPMIPMILNGIIIVFRLLDLAMIVHMSRRILRNPNLFLVSHDVSCAYSSPCRNL